MKPAPFDYIRAGSVQEAVDLLVADPDESKLLAGGQSLLPLMGLRLAQPRVLVDISRIPALREVRTGAGVVHVGAGVRHAELERGPVGAPVRALLPVVAEAARLIGHAPIRTFGTFGGSLVHADPLSEWCLLALVLDATLVAQGPDGRREIAVDDYFLGPYTTALDPTEVLTEVVLDSTPHHSAMAEFSRRHGDYGIVLAAVALTFAAGRCVRARVGLGGVAGTPVRATAVENALLERRLTDEELDAAADLAGIGVEPVADAHGSADYRRALCTVMVRRALQTAVARGGGMR